MRQNMRIPAAFFNLREQVDVLENNPMLKRTIEVRNPYVDPLN